MHKEEGDEGYVNKQGGKKDKKELTKNDRQHARYRNDGKVQKNMYNFYNRYVLATSIT